MIDTDKYEGHTEGPWYFCLGYDIKSDTYTGINPLKGGGDRVNGPVILSEYQFAKGIIGHRADIRLIEDAPLLLEDYKRLRKQYTELREALVGDSPNWTHEELIEQALELSKPAELEFGEWHTDEGDEEE